MEIVEFHAILLSLLAMAKTKNQRQAASIAVGTDWELGSLTGCVRLHSWRKLDFCHTFLSALRLIEMSANLVFI